MSFRDTSMNIHDRTLALISELRVDEKIGLLSGHQLAIPRLGISERFIGTEFARGWSSHDREQHCTVLPQTIGIASTFDRKLIHEAGRIVGRESRAYYNLVNKSLFGFGPTVDMERDIRWGRNEEAYGEDPYVSGSMSAAYTRGIVGEEKYPYALPLLKHFVCNNTEEKRDRYDAVVPEKLLREYYFEPFRRTITEGGGFGVMTAYNKLNGKPGLVNPIIRSVVRDEWGGRLICSDGGAFGQIMTAHGLTSSHAQTLAAALKTGANIMLDSEEMVEAAAKEALSDGLMTEEELDKGIYDVLYLRFMLGEFDETEPYSNLGLDDINTDEDKRVSLKLSEEQFVLLKNDGILPLSREKTVAVIGPQADENFVDWYTGFASYDTTIREGFEKEFGRVLCDHGRDIIKLKSVEGGYLRLDEEANAVFDADEDTAEELEVYDWGFGYVNYLCRSNGKLLQEDQGVYRATAEDAIMWFVRPIMTPEGKDVITFKSWNGSNIALKDGRLYMTDEPASGFKIQVISKGSDRVRELSKKADAVVCCMGNHPLQVGREGYDRESIRLPKAQEILIRAANEVNDNTILLMVSSYPFGVEEFDRDLRAVVFSTHAGPELGNAAANIFTGKANPSGRCVQTWYRSDYDFPSIFEYDIEKSGMTYLYMKEEPLYAFGHGLSYSEFEYGNLKIIKEMDDLYAEVLITNTSDICGDEIIQIYYSVVESRYTRPGVKLCAYERVHMNAHETLKVRLRIDNQSLMSFDTEKSAFILENGNYVFKLCRSCREVINEVSVNL